MDLLNKHTQDIQQICSECNVRKLYAFGSVLKGNFSKDSDLDFIVEFNPLDTRTYSHNYFALKFSLENIFKRKIDLLEENAIKNPYFREAIENSREVLYAA
jgi:uncharacterized protein